MPAAEAARPASAAPSGVEAFERADGGEGDGQAQAVAEEGGRHVDPWRRRAGHARAEGGHVERLAVAGDGGLGFRGADQVAPGIAVQRPFGGGDEFVQRLEALVDWFLVGDRLVRAHRVASSLG